MQAVLLQLPCPTCQVGNRMVVSAKNAPPPRCGKCGQALFTHFAVVFGYVYVLTPMGVAEKVALTGRFPGRKMREYERIRAEIEALGGKPGQGSAHTGEFVSSPISQPDSRN